MLFWPLASCPPEPKASGSNPLGRIPENKRLSFSSALIILSVGSLRHFLANLDLQSLVFHLGVSPFFTTASRRLAKIRPICRGRFEGWAMPRTNSSRNTVNNSSIYVDVIGDNGNRAKRIMELPGPQQLQNFRWPNSVRMASSLAKYAGLKS